MRSLAGHPVPQGKLFPPACLLDTAVPQARAQQKSSCPFTWEKSARIWAGIYSRCPSGLCLGGCRIRFIPMSQHLAACVAQRGEGEGGIWVTRADSFAGTEKGLLHLSSGRGGGAADAEERVEWQLLRFVGQLQKVQKPPAQQEHRGAWPNAIASRNKVPKPATSETKGACSPNYFQLPVLPLL